LIGKTVSHYRVVEKLGGVADGRVERVTSIEQVPLVAVELGSWIGIAPDDSPLVLREMSGSVEVYAFDVEWP
jgi:hypothetical protein